MGEKYEKGDWYRAPLWYDIVFGDGTEEEADFLEAVRVEHGLSRGRRALEPACVSGRLIIELASRGWRCHGFDAEPAMVEFAALRAQQEGVRERVSVWEDRMERFAVPGKQRFDLVFSLLSTFKYLGSERDVTAFLEATALALAPGGLLVMGTHLTDYARTLPEHERWVGERDGIRVVCNTRTWPADKKTRLEPMRNRLRVTEDGEPAARVETHWIVRSYSDRELSETVAQSTNFGLELAAAYDFDYDTSRPLGFQDWANSDTVVLVLRKRT